MKLLYQLGLILFITFLGEVCHDCIPLPIPASIYGLVLMLLALMTGIIKLRQVKLGADLLLDIMPPMFIPAAVGLMTAWKELQEVLVPVLLITVVTTVLVMGVTGKVTQKVIRRRQEKEGDR